MSRMSDAARRNEKNAVNFKHSGKGEKINRSYKGNLCRHANTFGDCAECTKEANARKAHNTRVVHRAKRVKKAKKKKRRGGVCSFIALALLAVPAGLLYGAYQLIDWAVS